MLTLWQNECLRTIYKYEPACVILTLFNFWAFSQNENLLSYFVKNIKVKKSSISKNENINQSSNTLLSSIFLLRVVHMDNTRPYP